MQKDGAADPRIVQLEQRLAISEEKRREEEKKRAILEGKVRHLENVAKQQSPFKFQILNKGRKGPPPHMPDIAEGREENVPASIANGPSAITRSPTVRMLALWVLLKRGLTTGTQRGRYLANYIDHIDSNALNLSGKLPKKAGKK